ncbi:MAG: hypothetical protein ACRC6K_07960 [Fusobacteriaceae bacterium]
MSKIIINCIQVVCIFFIGVLITIAFKNQADSNFYKISFQQFLTLLFTIINIILLVHIYCIFVRKLSEKQKQNEFILHQLDNVILILDKNILHTMQDESSRKELLTYQRKLKKNISLLKKIVPQTQNAHMEEIETYFESYYIFSNENNQNCVEFNKHTQEYLRNLTLAEDACLNLQSELLGFIKKE